MTARPVFPPAEPEGPIAPEPIFQDYGKNGALIVTPDTSQQWPVKLQGVDTLNGVVRDLKSSPRGELVTAAADHVIYQANYTGTPSGLTVLVGPIQAEGFSSASIYYTVQPSAGGTLQVSMNGVDWVAVNTVANAGNTYGGSLWSANAILTASLPPCMFIRLVCGSSSAIANGKFVLGLSKTPRPDFMMVRIGDAQVSDNSVAAGTTTIQQLLIGGADASKKTRILAADGTVNAKSQLSTNAGAGNAPANPFYGHVLTTAITRIAPYGYNVDQPAALQSNTRGELQVDQNETRRMLEQQLLAQQAAAMQLLDPNWGFELR